MLRYPAFKEESSLSPVDRLFICETCQRAEWLCADLLPVIYCHHVGHGRMREATTIEYAMGKKALKGIIPTNDAWDMGQ